MTLLSASITKTASDNAEIQSRAVLTSSTMTAIVAKINSASSQVDTDERTYKINIEFEGDVNGRTKPIEIIQADDSRILLKDIESALVDAGYRVSCRGVKTREGKSDKIKIQIAWD